MKEFLQGNVAAAESALTNGLDIFCGYPITPSSECMEHIASKMSPKKFINAYSEIETINILYGSGACGARCMSSTSGCGLSLMREGLSYAVGASVPMVIYNVMRFSPGLGGLSPNNEDISLYWGIGHGQSKVPILIPSTVQEIADCTMWAFDIADSLRMPVLVMTDAVCGQMYESCIIHKSPHKIIKEWAIGKDHHNVVTSRRQAKVIGSYRTQEDEQQKQIKYILERESQMYTICKSFIENTHHFKENKEGIYITGIGTTGRVVQEVAEQMGYGYFVPIMLSPFPVVAERINTLFVVEVGGAQLADICQFNFPNAEIIPITYSNNIPDEEDLKDRILKILTKSYSMDWEL